MSEKYYLIGVFSENNQISSIIANYFGKPGQKSDMQFYDRLDEQNNAVFCAVNPFSYPDKLKPLIQSLVISNIHILAIDNEKGLTAAVGEILIAMELFYKHIYNENSIPIITISNITAANEYMLEENEKKIKKLISATALKSAPIFILKEKEDRENLKKYILDSWEKLEKPSLNKEDTFVLIDHVFPVRGIGTVILGTICAGKIEVGDMLDLVGLNKKTIIRSIQKQDRDFKSATAGEHIGIAVKGIKPEELNRNCMLARPNLFDMRKSFKARLFISPFYQNISDVSESLEKRQFTIFVNLANTPIKIKTLNNNPLKPIQSMNSGEHNTVKVECSNPIPIPKKDPKGIIVELNKFANKSRILGYCEILLD
ncbi:MAG: EF-Tu/IF-2/RF-3 family GTPase [Promethearchaeota archaeon]